MIRQLRAEIELAAERILPEAPAVYIGLVSELPSTFRCNGAMAFSGKDLDVALRPHLPGRRGRGVAVVVDDLELADYVSEICRARPAAPRKTLLRAEFATLVCHELAHVIGESWIPSPGEPPPAETIRRAEILAWCLLGAPPRDPVPWAEHSASFFRLLLHVAYRLRTVLRWSFVPQADHELYGLSPLWRYEGALGDEPDRLGHLPLTAISDNPPPAAFARSWAADLKRWFAAIDSATDFQVTALLCGLRLFNPFTMRCKMTDVLEKVTAEHAAMKRKRQERFGQLVQRLASGVESDPAHAAATLDEAGKTPEELKEAVALCRRRQELRSLLDGQGDLVREAADLRRKIQAADQLLGKAEDAHAATSGPLFGQLEAIGTAQVRVAEAERELRRTCPRSDVGDALEKLETSIQEVATQSTARQVERRAIRENAARLTAIRDGIKPDDDPWNPRRHEREAAGLARRVDDERAVIKRLDGEVDALNKRRSDLVARRDALLSQQLETW